MRDRDGERGKGGLEGSGRKWGKVKWVGGEEQREREERKRK